MGKRSQFERRERDFYPTPAKAVVPLLPHLVQGTVFIEPCAGAGDLMNHLTEAGHWCLDAFDIEPQAAGITERDAMKVIPPRGVKCITNPAWPMPGQGGEPTVSLALHLSDHAPTWLLLSADFAHNLYFDKLADRCVRIVSVGRVSWMENGVAGKDNCAWYLFDAHHEGATAFVGRAA